MGLRVERAIGVQRLEAIARGADSASDGRNVVDQFEQLRHVMCIGGRGVRDDGNAGPEHEEDAGQTGAIGDGFAPRVAFSARSD